MSASANRRPRVAAANDLAKLVLTRMVHALADEPGIIAHPDLVPGHLMSS